MAVRWLDFAARPHVCYDHPVAGTYEVLEEHLRAGRLDPAEAMARHLLDANPQDADAHTAYARISALRGQVDDGILRLERLLAANPRLPNALAWLAVFWRQKGDAERALLLARRAASLGATVAEADSMLGDDALSRGDLDEAHTYFERAIAAHARSHRGYLGRGRIWWKKGELADAEDAFAKAVELAPRDLEGWLALIDVEIEGGADEAADDNITMALKQHAGHPELLSRKASQEKKRAANDPVQAGLIPVRGALYAGDGVTATSLLDDLAHQYPDDPRYLYVDAEIAAVSGQGDVPFLINELQRVIRERPTAWEPRAALGRLLLRPGPMQNMRAAISHCEDAWKSSGEHPRAGLFLFEAYAMFGKRPFAVALGKRIAQGESIEAGLVRQLLLEFGEKV
jgi:tetratricopeptide (TPR) repeat protein